MGRYLSTKKRGVRLTSILVLIVVVYFFVWNHVWYSPEIRARVLTSDGVPIVGAIVVANWNIVGYFNGASMGQIAIAETVTDEDGAFNIPSWGPRYYLNGILSDKAPTVRIFKLGFEPLVVLNSVHMMYDLGASPYIKFRLQDQNLVLKAYLGKLQDYEKLINPFMDSLDIIYDRLEQCNWKATPRLLLSLQHLKEQLEALNIPNNLLFAYQYAGIKQYTCGDAALFFSMKK